MGRARGARRRGVRTLAIEPPAPRLPREPANASIDGDAPSEPLTAPVSSDDPIVGVAKARQVTRNLAEDLPHPILRLRRAAGSQVPENSGASVL